jgi:hypothetical protein
MRILCADIRLVGKPHHDWKEGYELMYAFRKLGVHCDIAGPHGLQYTETDIPHIAHNYDLIIITENYPSPSTWKWWNWASIRTPKLFWAIDTHMMNYHHFLVTSGMKYVAFAIRKHQQEYGLPNSFPMYYGLSTIHQWNPTVYPKEYDTVFLGTLNVDPRRKEICDRFGILTMSAFGADYIITMKKARICFNKSMSNDINAKYFEIMSSGSFLLTNFNQELIDLFDPSVRDDLRACMYTTDDEIGEKIQYYLAHEEEREAIAKRLYDYVWAHHTWEARCKQILQFVTS